MVSAGDGAGGTKLIFTWDGERSPGPRGWEVASGRAGVSQDWAGLLSSLPSKDPLAVVSDGGVPSGAQTTCECAALSRGSASLEVGL